jgi:hypothetical protein
MRRTPAFAHKEANALLTFAGPLGSRAEDVESVWSLGVFDYDAMQVKPEFFLPLTIIEGKGCGVVKSLSAYGEGASLFGPRVTAQL